jgi:CIC family chloride channel protein
MALASQLDHAVGRVNEFFRRHWRRLLLVRERLRMSEEAFHLVLAAGIGVIGGVTNFAYHIVNQLTKWLVLGRTENLVEIAEGLVPWERVLVPTIGAMAAGLILYLGLRLIGNPGLSNLLEVVVAGDGRLALRPALTNAVSSLISISTGASIGREGLLIQLSSTLASKLGQLGGWQPYRLRLLVACGAAAGISGVYNAPISGAVFAAQIVLGNFSMNLFGPVLVSSVVASVISRTFFGINHWFDAPVFEFTRLSQLPWFLLLGALTGAAGALFLKCLNWSEALFARIRAPLYIRMGLAGLIVGLIAWPYPEVWGNGYEATYRLLREVPTVLFVLGLFAAKFVATAATVGGGAVGGVFTPTLFLGAALGSLFEVVLHRAGLAENLPTGCFTLVAMGSMLSATTHSPLLALIMLFELSLNYSLVPPLMLACTVSTLVARRLHRESIYTEPLRRKGLDLERENPRIGAAMERTIGDLMRAPIQPLHENTSFREIADRFLRSSRNFLPVVNENLKLVGVVALHDMKEYLKAGDELNSVIALDVMRPPPPCLTPGQKLHDALPILLASELRNLPVVNDLGQGRLIGSVERAEALNLITEAITSRPTTSTAVPHATETKAR